MFTAIINRIRVFGFGIAVAFMGLYSPGKTLHAVKNIFDRAEFFND